MTAAPPDRFDSIDQWAEYLSLVRGGSRVVHCHGVFDLLHIGHIRYFQKAKRLGDILIVTVTPDRFVNKGPHRPVFGESLRLDAIAALECVDHVALNQWPTAVEAIRMLRPDIYCKGAEFRDRKTPELLREEQAVGQCGGRVEFVEDVVSSSTTLINNYMSPFDPQVEQYLQEFRGRHSASQLSQLVDGLRGSRVLVVGEAVVDEYCYCAVTGRAMKSATIATKFHSQEQFAAGSLAVANHVAAFCDDVRLLAMLGDIDSRQSWVQRQLRDNVRAEFFLKPDSPTIFKRQYLEDYYQTMLFAADTYDDRPLDEDASAEVCRRLERQLQDVDLVLVTDLGHQFLTPDAVRLLCERAPLLAVTTQADPTNYGVHTISRYTRADYACLSQQDLSIDCRSRTLDDRTMLRQLAGRVATPLSAVTLGQNGCLLYDGEEFAWGAGLATRVADRNGAGEAFFAVSALCAAAQADPSWIAFCGNLAGAQAVAAVGTACPLDRLQFLRHGESLLK